MRLPILRIIVLAIVVEATAIAILAVLVAIFGPRGSGDSGAMQAFAEHLGQFVGPIASAVLCFLGAWWLAQRSNAKYCADSCWARRVSRSTWAYFFRSVG